MTQIVLFENIHPSAKAIFKAAGYTKIANHSSALPPDELQLALKGANVVGIRSRSQFDMKIFENATELCVLGCFCIGTNQVNLESAMLHGIPVFNAPFANTRSVAELTLGEAILLLRRIPEKNYQIRNGYWDKSAIGSFEIRGKTLGIIGYGNIGSQISTLSEGLGMRVIYYDIEDKLPLGNAKSTNSLIDLLKQSDVITLHIPGGKENNNLINKESLSYMKKGSIIINASRGEVIDMDALYESLKSGHISGAALDVFPCEPKNPGESLNSPLIEFQNVILTPHIAGSTQESQENIGHEVAEKLVRFIKTGSTKGAVNFPEIPYIKPSGKTRILHMHYNTPGALGMLTNLLAKNGLNIISQNLQTKGQLGYVITDVDSIVSNEVLTILRKLPMTIRCVTINHCS
ncbi:MAG: phosphoglycerate dehydrogenase [Bordetella sp.]|nr:MAG: phosphoglycerate dehydrogenase [Bordetella sp.]